VLQLPDAQADRAGALQADQGAEALVGLLNLEGLALLGQADDGVEQAPAGVPRLAGPQGDVAGHHGLDVGQGGAQLEAWPGPLPAPGECPWGDRMRSARMGVAVWSLAAQRRGGYDWGVS
jgi:hypothetical protein